MKGNETLLQTLNYMLADELAAINQYMVHAEMYESWGYEKLNKATEKRAIDEMHHAEKLISRILFLEGRPIVSELHPIHIGDSVEKSLNNDCLAEQGAIKMYNDGIRQALDVGDNGSRELLEEILGDEEKHIDWIEAQLDQIKQLGLQTYLTEQID